MISFHFDLFLVLLTCVRNVSFHTKDHRLLLFTLNELNIFSRDLEITKTVTEKAPEPILGVGVRQAGKLVTGELNVSPGTPLQMEIFLDKVSADIYGILVTHMQVTDTKSQEETIIYNG